MLHFAVLLYCLKFQPLLRNGDVVIFLSFKGLQSSDIPVLLQQCILAALPQFIVICSRKCYVCIMKAVCQCTGCCVSIMSKSTVTSALWSHFSSPVILTCMFLKCSSSSVHFVHELNCFTSAHYSWKFLCCNCCVSLTLAADWTLALTYSMTLRKSCFCLSVHIILLHVYQFLLPLAAHLKTFAFVAVVCFYLLQIPVTSRYYDLLREHERRTLYADNNYTGPWTYGLKYTLAVQVRINIGKNRTDEKTDTKPLLYVFCCWCSQRCNKRPDSDNNDNWLL